MTWTTHIFWSRHLPNRMESHAIVRRQLEDIALQVSRRPLRVLDCCVGMGEFLESLEGDSRFECSGIDFDSACVDEARQHAPSAHIEVADATAIPPHMKADVAVATALIEHVESPVRLLQSMRRAADWALVMTPNLGRPQRTWMAARRQLRVEPAGHFQGYDRHLLAQVLANQGWEVQRIDARFVDAPWGSRWLSYGPLLRAFPWLGSELHALCRGC